MSDWPGSIAAVTLFVEDLDAAKTFYDVVFGLPIHFADTDSAVFRFGDTLVNLLVERAAPEVISPGSVAPAHAGARFVLTVKVDDVDAMCAELIRRGAELLNGPMDRPWGIRTASFVDLDGYIWELAPSSSAAGIAGPRAHETLSVGPSPCWRARWLGARAGADPFGAARYCDLKRCRGIGEPT